MQLVAQALTAEFIDRYPALQHLNVWAKTLFLGGGARPWAKSLDIWWNGQSPLKFIICLPRPSGQLLILDTCMVLLGSTFNGFRCLGHSFIWNCEVEIVCWLGVGFNVSDLLGQVLCWKKTVFCDECFTFIGVLKCDLFDQHAKPKPNGVHPNSWKTHTNTKEKKARKNKKNKEATQKHQGKKPTKKNQGKKKARKRRTGWCWETSI